MHMQNECAEIKGFFKIIFNSNRVVRVAIFLFFRNAFGLEI